jgi:hypothetical protein
MLRMRLFLSFADCAVANVTYGNSSDDRMNILTADVGSMAARMGMPPAGTRRPQTPAATGPDMMKDYSSGCMRKLFRF